VESELSSCVLLEHWENVDNGLRLENELYREIGEGHILHNVKIKAIARRCDCDDVLFEITGETARFAFVHLTWSGKKELDPRWPATTIYKGFEEWGMMCMIPINKEYEG
jgi:hypothetical protein